MSYVDSNLEFSDAQAVTATAISSNVYDLLTTDIGAGSNVSPNATLDIGAGQDLYLVVNTQTTATDSGSDATLTISLESDSAAALSSAPTVHFTTSALAFAAFATAGTNLVRIKLPLGQYQRYLGVRYTVASGPLTAGKFDAFITTDVNANRPYKSGFTVQ